MKLDNSVTGATESASLNGSGSASGGVTWPAPARAMHDQSEFGTEKARAVVIPWGSSGGTWIVEWPLLSQAVNQPGSGINTDGTSSIPDQAIRAEQATPINFLFNPDLKEPIRKLRTRKRASMPRRGFRIGSKP